MYFVDLTSFDIVFFMLACISTLLFVCFLQSGVDKIIDRQGNELWLNKHFSNTVFKGFVSILITIITLLELLSAIFLFIGLIFLAMYQSIFFIQYGLMLCSITLLCLFLGQRIAKDYEGAYVLVVYFTLTMLGCYVSTL
tara:strand:- start:1148 stop:1564 length:417 start_codon:yes stop_codon:yes gene_type:complete